MTTGTRSHRVSRRAVAGAAVALAAALLPLVPHAAQAQQTFNRGIARSCPSDAPDAFTDDDGNAHEAAIDCVAFWEIALGTSATRYSPRTEVTREQMATFVAKMMRTAGHEFAQNPPDAFDDDDGSVHEANIDVLAAEGIVQGDAQGNYNPKRVVRRDQMATFINGALEVVTGEQITSGEDFFTDDDASPHEENINALASIGVVAGTGPATYGPGEAVRRDAMASFVARGADYLAEQGHWPVLTDIAVEPSTSQALQPSPSSASDSGSRQYTVEVPGGISSVHIALYPAEHVQSAPDGTVTVGPNQRVPDGSGVSIERVNGQLNVAANFGTGDTLVEDVTPIQGIVIFTIDSVVNDTVVPVVWQDSIEPGENAIDLADDGTGVPKEAFGAGGRLSWIPSEAVSGQTQGSVVEGNPGLDYYTFAGQTFEYDSNDMFNVNQTSLTMAAFERLAGPGTQVDVNYSSNPTAQSTHTITNAAVHRVQWVDARRADADGDGTRDDVTVRWGAAPAPGLVYDVYRSDDPNDCGPTPGAGAQTIDGTDSIIAANLTTTIAHDINRQSSVLQRNDYYLVVAKDPTTGLRSQETASTQCVLIPSTASEPVATTAPATTDARLDADVPTIGAVDGNILAGDIWTIVFDKPVVVAADATISVTETQSNPPVEPKQAAAARGQNANFTLSADGTTLTVRFTTTLVDPDDGAVISYGVRIIGATGISNSAGAWNPLSPSNDDVEIGCVDGKDTCSDFDD